MADSSPTDTAVADSSATDAAGEVASDAGEAAICRARCPADPEVTMAYVSSCEMRLSSGGMCGPKWRAYYQCFFDKRVCASDGKTDYPATAAACSAEQSALTACI